MSKPGKHQKLKTMLLIPLFFVFIVMPFASVYVPIHVPTSQAVISQSAFVKFVTVAYSTSPSTSITLNVNASNTAGDLIVVTAFAANTNNNFTVSSNHTDTFTLRVRQNSLIDHATYTAVSSASGKVSITVTGTSNLLATALVFRTTTIKTFGSIATFSGYTSTGTTCCFSINEPISMTASRYDVVIIDSVIDNLGDHTNSNAVFPTGFGFAGTPTRSVGVYTQQTGFNLSSSGTISPQRVTWSQSNAGIANKTSYTGLSISLNDVTMTSTTSYTQFMAPSLSDLGNWVFVWIWLLLPTSLMMGFCFLFHLGGNRFVFLTQTGLLLGSLFGTFAGQVPWALTVVIGLFLILYLWRSRSASGGAPMAGGGESIADKVRR